MPAAVRRHVHVATMDGICGKDVSCIGVETRETLTFATAKGANNWLREVDGKPHPAGEWASVGSCDSTDGCKVKAVDTVFSGRKGPLYGKGKYLWEIPWEFRAPSGRPGARVRMPPRYRAGPSTSCDGGSAR